VEVGSGFGFGSGSVAVVIVIAVVFVALAQLATERSAPAQFEGIVDARPDKEQG
jgi:hypothetical protein